MNYKEHTSFIVDFVSEFVNGEMERYFFDLDYSYYVIEHYPEMEFEDAGFAHRFSDTVDRAYERGSNLNLSDEAFRVEISKALDLWLAGKKA